MKEWKCYFNVDTEVTNRWRKRLRLPLFATFSDYDSLSTSWLTCCWFCCYKLCGYWRYCYWLQRVANCRPRERDKPQSLWQQFYQQADELASIQEISQTEINRYPKSLLLSSSQYPNFGQFQWLEIQQLWQISQRCQLGQSSLANSNLLNSIEFELALCQERPLAGTWFDNKFDNKTLLHPAGGSFADRYLASLDKVSANRFLAQHQNQLTLANTAHPLHPLLSELAPQGVDALLSGYRAYLSRQKKRCG